jgi:hypothetical protein
MALPCADDSLDSYTVAFGIRNVTSVPTALQEAYRVSSSQMVGLMFCWRLHPCQRVVSFSALPVATQRSEVGRASSTGRRHCTPIDDADVGCAAAGAAAGWPLPMPGVLTGGAAGTQGAVRGLLVQCDSTDRQV